MNKKCCVFVDGENLRKSIVSLFQREFDERDYLPKTAKWAELFDYLVNEACVGFQPERVRAYWYVIEQLDVFPGNLPKPSNTGKISQLKTSLSRNQQYKDELASITDDDEMIKRMSEMRKELKDREESMRRRFNGWQVVQDGISKKQKAIEFRRAGAIQFNLFEHSLGEEKAVDVKLATDLIILADIYDTAVIVSGDQDYVPAVKVVKDWGKRVINVAFQMRSGDLLPGGARRLNVITDETIVVGHDDLRSYLNIR